MPRPVGGIVGEEEGVHLVADEVLDGPSSVRGQYSIKT